MDIKSYNIRLHNPIDNEYVTYFTLSFCSVEDFDQYVVGSHNPSYVNPKLPANPNDWEAIFNEQFEDLGLPERFLDYAKPLVTGLNDKSNEYTLQQFIPYSFGRYNPFIYHPFNPFRAGDDHNSVKIGDRVYTWFGYSGNNEEVGHWERATSFRCWYNWPSTAVNSELFNVEAGTTASQQFNSTIKSYFPIIACTDMNDPFNTIAPDRGGIISVLIVASSYGVNNHILVQINGSKDRPSSDNYYKFNAQIGNIPEEDIKDAGITSSDPYEKGGTSQGQQGGTGNFDASSDTIPVPSLPSLSAVDLGLVSVFKPTQLQAKTLGAFLWNPDNLWDDVKKIVANPIDTILGFSIVPYTPDVGSNPVTVKLGNLSSGVSMLPVTNQYKEIDCGTLNIQEFWGSYLDYSPYTKTHLYLPYVGIVPIDIDDIMGKELHVIYHCDCLSGACIAYILSNGSQIACYEGQVSAQIPISQNDYSNLMSSAITAVGAGLTLAVSGGSSAPAAVPALAGAAVNALKPNVQKSGTLAGMGGIMTTQYPFLIAQRPRQCVPENYNSYGGYPSYVTSLLGDCEGFTKVSEINLQVATATEEEKREIEDLLKEGVII